MRKDQHGQTTSTYDRALQKSCRGRTELGVCTALQRCVAAFGARSKQDPNATDLKKLTAEELAEWEQRAREGSVLAVLASDLEQSQGARLSSFAKKQLLS